MNKLTSQATWEGLGVPLPKDFQIQSPLYREIDKLNRANNDAFIVVLTLCFILGLHIKLKLLCLMRIID